MSKEKQKIKYIHGISLKLLNEHLLKVMRPKLDKLIKEMSNENRKNKDN
jgi:hypothetical protein